MMRLWPRFHDPSLRLSPMQRWRVHWRANLLMLRQPKDIALFTLWSMSPTVALVVLVEGFPELFTADALRPTDMTRLLLVALLTLVVFLTVQHLVFVAAMQRTYVPHVRTALAENGLPVCLACGQRMPPETPGARCPECGSGRVSATMVHLREVPTSARQEPPR